MENMLFEVRCNECKNLINSFCYSYRSFDRDDIIQECRLGIFDAMKKYDSSKNSSFPAFARDYMRSRINDFVAASSYIPMSRESLRKCNLVKKYLYEYKNFTPDDDTLKSLKLTRSEFDKFKYDYKFLNLDNNVSDESETTYSDIIPSDEERHGDIYNLLDDYIVNAGVLTSDELNMLIDIVQERLTETAAAASLGISRQAVSKRIKKYLGLILNTLIAAFGGRDLAREYLESLV